MAAWNRRGPAAATSNAAADLAQYRSDCDVYRSQLAERDAALAALRVDLAMLKRQRGTAVSIGSTTRATIEIAK